MIRLAIIHVNLKQVKREQRKIINVKKKTKQRVDLGAIHLTHFTQDQSKILLSKHIKHKNFSHHNNAKVKNQIKENYWI